MSSTELLRGARDDLNQAAVNAVKAVEFEPALQKDIPVAVWIAIPINFMLEKD